MVQDQLLGYVKDQIKLGVSRDAIKAALTGAGWAANDVEDTMKKADEGAAAGKAPSGAAAPAFGTMITGGSPERAFPAAPGGGVKGGAAGNNGTQGAEPRSIRVSDLISTDGAPAPASTVSPKTAKMDSKKTAKIGGPSRFGGGTPGATMMAAPAGHSGGGRGRKILMIVGIIIILGLGGFAGYLYFQNMGLASKVASLSGESANVTAQIDALNGNISSLDASNTALVAQVSTLASENADLVANLSFVAAPPESSAATGTAAETSVTVQGTLTKPKTTYVLTTQYGVSVLVKNSADAAVAAVLMPLADGTSTVSLAGTHTPGSAYLTVTAVNGSSVMQNQSSSPSSASSSPSQVPTQ